MNVVVWCLTGAIIGLLASIAGSRPERPNVVLIKVIAGIVGAVATGWLLSGLFGTSTVNHGFDLPALFISCLGAGLVLPVVDAVRGASA